MDGAKLETVATPYDIEQSLNAFNTGMQQNQDLVRSLIRTTSLWVFDPRSKKFGPSKFVGFKSMALARYQSARDGNVLGAKFDGHVTRNAIESILGPYTKDPRLSVELTRWAESSVGSGVLEGIDESKWEFVSL